MARDFKRTNKLAVISDLNVTPLIDLAFSLLIIFMITTPVIEQYNRIDLPEQSIDTSSAASEKKDRFITIDAHSLYHLDNDPVGKSELVAQWTRLCRQKASNPSSISGGTGIFWQQIIDVINMLKERNLTKLSLDTKAG